MINSVLFKWCFLDLKTLIFKKDKKFVCHVYLLRICASMVKEEICKVACIKYCVATRGTILQTHEHALTTMICSLAVALYLFFFHAAVRSQIVYQIVQSPPGQTTTMTLFSCLIYPLAVNRISKTHACHICLCAVRCTAAQSWSRRRSSGLLLLCFGLLLALIAWF
jgi:hypothetical protein